MKKKFIGIFGETLLIDIALWAMIFLGIKMPDFGWFLSQKVVFWAILMSYLAFGLYKAIELYEIIENNYDDLDNLFG